MRYELGFVGAGNMAEAIARAAIDHSVVTADRMIAADPVEARRNLFATLGVAVVDDNAKVIRESKQIMLAIKPQTLAQLGDDLGAIDTQRQVVLSIMAGISTRKIEQTIGGPARVVRIMPNTPLMVGRGMAGVALGQHARPDDDALAMNLFNAAGVAIRVDESALDAITAVSGSGPAYLFYLAEAMEQAAAELGLGEHAQLLVQQTLHGAATLLAQSPDTAAELRGKVTSPGGTTEAAVKHLDSNATTQVIINAVKAAWQRSKELGD